MATLQERITSLFQRGVKGGQRIKLPEELGFNRAATYQAFLPYATNAYATGGHVYKAVIPQWFYKPPWGLPISKDVVEIRRLAASPYVTIVRNTVANEISGMDWGLEVEEGANVPPEVLLEVKKFLYNPNRNEESLGYIIKQLVGDSIEIDGAVLEKVYNLKGDLVEIYARDAGLFTKNLDIHGVLPDINAYWQYSWTVGTPPIPFNKTDLIYMIRNPRTDTVYGRGEIETLYSVLRLLLYGIENNLEYYTETQTAMGVMKLAGATPEEIERFRTQWNETMRKADGGGHWFRRQHKLPIVSNDVEFVKTGFSSEELQDIEKQEWFTKLVWACFGMAPSEVGFCYSEDTRVLTKDGFKFIYEVNDSSEIAVVDPETKQITYESPDKWYVFNTTGPFHHYENTSVDVLVSPNHKMLYSIDEGKTFISKESNKIENNRVEFLQGGLEWVGESKEFIEIPYVEYNEKAHNSQVQLLKYSALEFSEFMGYYLSEGSVLKEMASKNNYMVRISQYNEKGRVVMRPLLTKLGFTEEGDGFRKSEKSLATYLHSFGGSHEKYIPSELKNLDKDCLQKLFDGLMLGDGHRSSDDCKNSTSVCYSTVSKQLAEDVQEIMIKLGYVAKVRHVKNSGKGEMIYSVTGNKLRITPRVRKDKHFHVEQYDGIMWCPSLGGRPFITERNGKIGIHFNTEDVNRATAIAESSSVKRKILKPFMMMLEYYFDTQLINSLPCVKGKYEDLIHFEFDRTDLGFEKAERDVLWGDYDRGLITLNQFLEKVGMPVVAGGDVRKNDASAGANFGQNVGNTNVTSPEDLNLGLIGTTKIDLRTHPHTLDLGEDGDKTVQEYDAERSQDKDTEEKAIYSTTAEFKALDTTAPLTLKQFEELQKHMTKIDFDFDTVLKKILGEETEKKGGSNEEMNELSWKKYGVKNWKDLPHDKQMIIIDETHGWNFSAEGKAVPGMDFLKKIMSVDLSAFAQTMNNAIHSAFNKGLDLAGAQTKQNFVANPNTVKFLQQYSFENIKGMEGEFRNDLRHMIMEGYKQNKTPEQLQEQIRGVFDTTKARAKMIVVTEINRAINAGKLQGFKDSGVKGWVVWNAEPDVKADDPCYDLNGMKRRPGKLFQVKGFIGHAPGAHPNCRCQLSFEPEE